MRGAATRGRAGSVRRVVHGDDIAAAIVDQVRDRDGALLVMSNSGTGLVSQRRGGVSAHVVSELGHPVLLIGPAVPDPVPLGLTTLVPSTVANDAPSQTSSIHLSASA